MQPITPHVQSTSNSLAPKQAHLHKLARDLEASFLSQMLQLAGLGAASERFGGGIGEDQLASMLSDAQARKLTESGGIGLAEAIYKSLEARTNAR